MKITMQKITTVLALLLFMPLVSFAAGLTSQQSTSLIAVVQSSPNTPASVFVPLITSFSNITVSQAISLIMVVQDAPSVPASAFVNLLTSFTVDTTTVQSTTPAVTPIATTQSNQPDQQISQTDVLSITPGKVTTTINSAHVEWDTNLPTDSKMFLTQGGSTQIIPSESGQSPHHIIDATGLLPGTQYSYTIEAIAGTQDQKVNGVFTTLLPVATGIVVWNGRGEQYVNNYIPDGMALNSVAGSNCGQAFFSVGVLDQFGNYMQNQLVVFTNPETGMPITQSEYVNDRGGPPLQEPAAIFSYFPQVATGTESILLTSGSVSRTLTLPITSVGPIDAQNGWKQENATEWQNDGLQTFNTSTGKCL